MALNTDQLRQLADLIDQIPGLVKRFGKDGQQIEAFVNDAKAAMKGLKKDEDVAILFGSLTLVILKALEGIKNFKVYNPSTWDLFKAMRLECDKVAIAANFENYKKLRNLS